MLDLYSTSITFQPPILVLKWPQYQIKFLCVPYCGPYILNKFKYMFNPKKIYFSIFTYDGTNRSSPLVLDLNNPYGILQESLDPSMSLKNCYLFLCLNYEVNCYSHFYFFSLTCVEFMVYNDLIIKYFASVIIDVPLLYFYLFHQGSIYSSNNWSTRA